MKATFEGVFSCMNIVRSVIGDGKKFELYVDPLWILLLRTQKKPLVATGAFDSWFVTAVLLVGGDMTRAGACVDLRFAVSAACRISS